jgi:tyrosine-protein phosphatase SIW14
MSPKSKPRIIAVSLVLACLVAVGSPSFAQEPRYAELPNFHKVGERLYRGAQPGKDGVKKLAELGVKTIIDLRGDGDRANTEKIAAEQAGLKYYNFGLSNFGRPGDEQVKQILAIIDAPENGPVFLHCRRGSDRTGTIVAVYRISHDGWNGERAIAEAKQYGLSWVEVGMKNYIADYYKTHAHQADAQSAAK